MTSAPIYQTRWSHPETVWGDVSKDVYDKYETFGYVERRIVYLESPAPIASAEEARPDKWVAKVRVTHKGYSMELSKYIAYALPEGVHELYTHPAAAQPSRAEVLEEAARMADLYLREHASFGGEAHACQEIADAIRALKDKP